MNQVDKIMNTLADTSAQGHTEVTVYPLAALGRSAALTPTQMSVCEVGGDLDSLTARLRETVVDMVSERARKLANTQRYGDEWLESQKKDEFGRIIA